MKKYTVHNIPNWLKPFLQLYGWIGAFYFVCINFVFRRFCRIEYVGKEHIENTPNHIFCLWHENLPLFFMAHAYFHKPNIWLTFPLWFMKPVHVMKKNIGVQELAYGASGHDGKVALQQVLTRLKEGWSTFVAPDGPKGPLKVAKDGVLIMSLKTGVPIISMSFQLEKEWRLSTWDKKRYPVFFTTLKVIYGQPIYVTTTNFEAIKADISLAMNDPSSILEGDPIPPAL